MSAFVTLGLLGAGLIAGKAIKTRPAQAHGELAPPASASAAAQSPGELTPSFDNALVELSVKKHDAPEEPKNLDLSRLVLTENGASVTTAAGKSVRLTLNAKLQTTANQLLSENHFPEAAVVMTDPKTGRVLVYASHVEGTTEPRDVCREAKAPSASVFKIVTAAALIDKMGIKADTKECYPDAGGEKIMPFHLRVDESRDKYCSTLGQAMGKSINPVFARLAERNLDPSLLEAKARDLGYGETLPFDSTVETSAITIPKESLQFARTAAGFWNSKLSPIHAAWMSSVIANGGAAPSLHIVERDAGPETRVLSRETAVTLTEMLSHTVTEGTSRKAFHDVRGVSYLPNISVAGKTGTLTDNEQKRYFTWFTGFAPINPTEGEHQVAISVLVVNGPHWKLKANVVAREMLRAYFAENGKEHVTPPRIGRIASIRRTRH